MDYKKEGISTDQVVEELCESYQAELQGNEEGARELVDHCY